MMEVKFKKLRDGVILPSKATEGSVGYDLYVTEDAFIKKGRQVLPLGFAMEFAAGMEAKIEPRSGYASKGMVGYEVRDIAFMPDNGEAAKVTFNPLKICINNEVPSKSFVALEASRFDADVLVGKINSDYRGEVCVIINNYGETFMIKAGQRIAQMTFYKVEDITFTEVEALSDTGRGEGGFNSSGV